MAEENNASVPQPREVGAGRSDRSGGPRDGQARREGGGNRDAGGFRIRLSDNELRAVRAVQDAFQLRSPVAALGFSVRTLAQMLDDGKLDALVAEQRAQGGARQEPRREGRRSEGRSEGRSERGGAGGGGGRVNPFARPQKPVAAVTAETAEPDSDVPAEIGSPEGSADDTVTVDQAAAAHEPSDQASVEPAETSSDA